MPHKMMPVSMHKSNWGAIRKGRQMGKSQMDIDELRKPESKKKQMTDFVRGRR